MAKKQSRRSISVNRSLFEQVTGIAKGRGLPLAQLTEAALRREIATSDDVPPTTFTGQEAAMLLAGLASLDQLGKVHPNEKPRFDALKARVLKISTLPATLAPKETTASNASDGQNDASEDVSAPDDVEHEPESDPTTYHRADARAPVETVVIPDEDTRVVYDEDAA